MVCAVHVDEQVPWASDLAASVAPLACLVTVVVAAVDHPVDTVVVVVVVVVD
jgi:hypothetical protein